MRVVSVFVTVEGVQIQRYPLQDVGDGAESPTSPDVGDVEMAKNRKEELMRKLEGMGYDVGYRFAERCVEHRLFHSGFRGSEACVVWLQVGQGPTAHAGALGRDQVHLQGLLDRHL